MSCGHTGKLFYDNCPDDPAQAGPGVHALVIGMSRYTLAGGKAPNGFRDIAGTAVGAGRFATWLVEEFYHPKSIPLRTVRLLLSPMESEKGSLPKGYLPEEANEANYDNVRSALQHWGDDCNSHGDNIAVLYVGGHGMATTEGALIFLPEANVHKDMYLYCINTAMTRELMAYCRARSNIYIYDCCSLRSKKFPHVLEGSGLGGQIFDFEGAQRAFEFTIMAARPGTETYAIGSRDGTLLSWALMQVLRKAGKLIDGYFAVTKDRIDSQLLPVMRQQRDVELPPGYEAIVKGYDDSAGITRPQPPPSFTIIFVPSPGAIGQTVTVTIEDEATGEAIAQRQVNGRDSEPVELRAGSYPVVAEYRAEDGSEKSKPYVLHVERDARVFSRTGREAP